MASEKMAENRYLNKCILIALPVTVILCGVLLTFWLLQTSPKAKPRKKQKNAVLVEVEDIVTVSEKIKIKGMGTVLPAQDVEITTRVSGEIFSMNTNVLPGGHVEKGDVLFQIDPVDYEISARQLASDVDKAESDLEIERGNQLVAQKEFELLGEKVRPEEKNLILRQPQLNKLTAALKNARAKYERALLDIERTTVKSPFNGVIQSRYVNIGSQVGVATPLVRLVGTDEFWIEVTLPVNKLGWLEISDEMSGQGSRVNITNESAWGEGKYREGKIVRLAADLEEKGRLAKLLVKVKDPLLLGDHGTVKLPLLIGSYVQVDIEGRHLENVVMIARKHIRDGNFIWVMGDNNTLQIKKIEILYKDHERVFVTGVDKGERLIITNLPVAVEGMAVRLQKEKKAIGSGDKKQSGLKTTGQKEQSNERS